MPRLKLTAQGVLKGDGYFGQLEPDELTDDWLHLKFHYLRFFADGTFVYLYVTESNNTDDRVFHEGTYWVDADGVTLQVQFRTRWGYDDAYEGKPFARDDARPVTVRLGPPTDRRGRFSYEGFDFARMSRCAVQRDWLDDSADWVAQGRARRATA